MNAANIGKANGLVSATAYREQLQALKALRDGIQGTTAGFNEALLASGKYNVETVKTLSTTQTLTKAIREQKLNLTDLRKNWGAIRREVTNSQGALAAASTMQWGSSEFGKQRYDVYVPKNLNGELNTARIRYGVINEAIKSAAQQTINWGKNTQWAGRQITVGLGVPVSIAAFAMTKLALTADREITRIQKVYDATIDENMTKMQQQIDKERQLEQVRIDSMNSAFNMANMYGQKLEDTLRLTGDLAAAGKQGQELTDTVAQVSRIATLGELEYQTAMDMTITLMSAYKQSAEDLTETFDFMNALESATVLNTQDFAEALPRMGGALANLGVDLKEAGVLMVALKNGGVDAAQGANALKSATTRLLRPTAAATNAFRAMGINLEDVVADTGGDLFQTLQILGAEMQGFNEVQRQQAIAALFGTYQFNRLNVAMDGLAGGLAGTEEGYEQVTRAMDVANMSAGELSTIASDEIQRLQQSLSGRFDRAIQTLKVQFARLGEPILAVLTPVVEWLTRFIGFFNGLPSIVKNGTMAVLAFMAALGPIVMLGGLLANLGGQIMKFFGVVGGLINRFKLLTPEERAAQLAAEGHTQALSAEAQATQQLTHEIERLTLAMQALHKEQAEKIATFDDPRTYNEKNQMMMDFDDANAAPKQLELFDDSQVERLQGAGTAAGKIEDATENAARNTTSMMDRLAGLAIAATAFSDMNDSSNGILANVINIAAVIAAINMSGLGTAIASMAKAGGGGLMGVLRTAGDKIGGIFKRAAGHMGQANKAAGGFGNILKNIVTNPATKLWGPVGLIAGGIGLMIQIRSQMTEAEAAQRRINESAQDWANILGFVAEQKIINEDGSEVVNTQAKAVEQAAKLREENEELATALRDAARAGDEFNKVYNMAVREALKVRFAGGTVEQAKQAFETALTAADMDRIDINRLLVRFESVELENAEGLKAALQEQLRQILSDLRAEGSLDAGWFRGLFGGDVSDEGRAAISEFVTLFTQGLNSAPDNMARSELMQGFVEGIDRMLGDSNAFDELKRNNSKFFEDLGMETASDAYDKMKEAMDLAAEAKRNGDRVADVLPAWAIEMLRNDAWMEWRAQYEESMEVALTDLGKGLGKSDAQIEEWISSGKTIADIMEDNGMATMTSSEAFNAYSEAVGRGAMAWAGYSDKQKLAILNHYRTAAGMEEAKHWTEGFGAALSETTNKVQEMSGELTNLADISLDDLTSDEYVNMIRDQYSTGMSFAYEAAERIWDDVRQAEMDGIEAASDARMDALEARADREDAYYDRRQDALEDRIDDEKDAFDDRWDRIMDGLDAEGDRARDAADRKIDAINDEIEALEKADKVRDELFEREKRRIARMAEMYSNSVDFNKALNAGDLDEAAKIFSNSAAQVQTWQAEDQQAGLDDVTEARKDALRRRIDIIEKERDAHLKAIDARKKALEGLKKTEQRNMEDRHERLKEELQAERDKAKKALEAAREKERRQTQDAAANAQKRWEKNKIMLQMELSTIQAFTPRNQAEKEKQIRMIEAAYAKYGINLRGHATSWSKMINDGFFHSAQAASNRVKNDIAWAEIGNKIQERVTSGIGIKMSDLVYYLKNGKWPSSDGKRFPSARMAEGWLSRHSGGPTWTSADRVGVPRSAGLYPSEVPAILKKGEYVVNAKATRKNLPLLSMINSHHSGGMVGGRKITGGDMAGVSALPIMQGLLIAATIEKAFGDFMGFGGAFLPGQPGGGGGSDGRFTTSNRNFPAPIFGVLSANTAAAVEFVQKTFRGIGGIGTVGYRPNKSDHPMGKALDVMIPNYRTPQGIALGTAIAEWFVQNPNVFGTKYVIWRDRIASSDGRGWQPYGHPSGASNDTLQHRDHPHISLYHQGGLVDMIKQTVGDLPALREGGSILHDNTLANLHKGETVLTRPLTEMFKKNVASGMGNQYDVTIDLRGAYVKEDVDIERAVEKVLDKIEYKNGRKRVIK